MKISFRRWKIAAAVGTLALSFAPQFVTAEAPAKADAAAKTDGAAKADAPELVEVKADEKLTLTVPKSWKQQQPSSRMRLAQFQIAFDKDDKDPAELAVFPPFGGSVSENVKRWIEQFQPQNRDVKMTQGSTKSDNKYVFVNVSGTYKKPDGPPIAQRTKPVDGYRMIAVMLLTEEGNYFLKLTGPDKTIQSITESFRHSFGGDSAKEAEYSL